MAKKNVEVVEEVKEVTTETEVTEEVKTEVTEAEVKAEESKKENWFKRTFTKENVKAAGKTMLKVGLGIGIGFGSAIAFGMKLSKPSEEEVAELEKYDDWTVMKEAEETEETTEE